MLEPAGGSLFPWEVRMDVSLLQQPLLLLWPHGGQRTARRNALAAAVDHRRAAADREAGQNALDAANAGWRTRPVSSALG